MNPIENLGHKAYLGDGAYADFDGYAVVLTAENGLVATDRIVLDPEVLRALETYVAKLRAGALALMVGLVLGLTACATTPTPAGISRDLDANLTLLADWPLSVRCQAVRDAIARCERAGLPSECAWDEQFDASKEDACWAIMACRERGWR